MTKSIEVILGVLSCNRMNGKINMKEWEWYSAAEET